MKKISPVKISSINDVKKIIKSNNFKIFCIGGAPDTRAEIWPFTLNTEVICSAKTGEFSSAKKKVKIKCFNKNKILKSAICKTPFKILNDPSVIQYIHKKSKNQKTAIYTFNPNKSIQRLCKQNNWTHLACDYNVYLKLNNRLKFYDILKIIGYNKHFQALKLSQLNSKISQVFDQFGEKIAIQISDSELNLEGGRGTFFFTKNESLKIYDLIKSRLVKRRITQDVAIIITKFITGATVSAIGCATKHNGIITSNLRYLLIDIPELINTKSDAKGIFCGHDWSLANKIPNTIQNQAKNILKKVGNELKRDGFLGEFGIDFIWNIQDNELTPIEVNPRLTGGAPTEAYVQLKKNEIPIAALHILEHLNINYTLNIEDYHKNTPQEGAHLWLFNPKSCAIKINRNIKGGVYEIKNNKLKWIRYGINLYDIFNSDEFIITSCIPTKGMIIKENKRLIRIISKRALTQQNGLQLNTFAKNIIQTLISQMKIECH